ncbi:MAG: sulfatase [Flavobacterium sp.]|nr:MAG: sulfatase [Flavobacterium sp.]
MKIKLFPDRFQLLKRFVFTFIVLSTLLRLIFLLWNISEVNTAFFTLVNSFVFGLFYDVGTVSFFAVPYALYLLFFPKGLYGSFIDKISTYFGYSIGLLIFLFSFFAEITFWEEFRRRFNFIAVDYLIYTGEVINNINESYPLPFLIGGILILTFLLLFFTKKKSLFEKVFTASTTFLEKLIPTLIFIFIAVIFGTSVTNKAAEFSENRYNNEIAKTGIYSFFAAFRNNELSFTGFYTTIDEDEAFSILKNKYSQNGDSLLFAKDNSIYRKIYNTDSLPEQKPNVIFICVESFSSIFLNYYNDEEMDTPTLDSLVDNSLFFENIFATGTRTIRGMEAITLSIPPTPGRSIVKRENNTDLFTISEVFKEKGYKRSFYYGGDGYFDNMNTFFGGNNFNIVDRSRGFILEDHIETQRTNIEDPEVTFENAWGVCDEDIYNKVIKEADINYKNGNLFFDFIMTTSNHKPYTYPDDKVKIPSGKNRRGGVQYTDFAIKEFLEEAKTKPWYANTVIVIMADHCAYSAGHQALDVKNYRIPLWILNAPNTKAEKIKKLASQIDVFPTLFSMFNWEYNTNLFGMDILKMKPKDERALIGNYRKLGLLKEDKLLVLSDQKKINYYRWNKENNELKSLPINKKVLKETVSYYQVSDYLFHNEGLKLKTLNIEK